MEPFITTAITLIIADLGKQALGTAFETFNKELSKDSYNWIKSVFFKQDGDPKEILTDLQTNPEDSLNVESAELEIKKSLRSQPNAKQWLIEIAKALEEKKPENTQSTTIQNSKNINTGSVNASGDFNIGDKFNSEP